MGTSSTELATRARTIFDELGYTVSGEGPEFLAEREWKVVHVTATAEEDARPTDDGLHCFVAPSDRVPALRRHLDRTDPGCEWAVIGVDGDDYEVERAPPASPT